MKRIWKIVSIALICGILAVPQIDARGRNNSSSQRTERSGNTSSRSNSTQRHNSGSNSNNRNSNSNSNSNQRPSGSNNNPRTEVKKPNNTSAQKTQRGHVTRPHCPPTRPYQRPTPPTTFRPHSGCPVLRDILGITFGTALNISIDYLNRHGYSVYGYGSDVVYLRNVNQYNYLWPDATLYYGVSGLTGSQFMYSTNHYDMTRYNMVYNTLINQYGSPVSVQNITNGVVATWWGYDNQYVSLEFRPIYTNNGQLRYFTTLSFGI